MGECCSKVNGSMHRLGNRGVGQRLAFFKDSSLKLDDDDRSKLPSPTVVREKLLQGSRHPNLGAMENIKTKTEKGEDSEKACDETLASPLLFEIWEKTAKHFDERSKIIEDLRNNHTALRWHMVDVRWKVYNFSKNLGSAQFEDAMAAISDMQSCVEKIIVLKESLSEHENTCTMLCNEIKLLQDSNPLQHKQQCMSQQGAFKGGIKKESILLSKNVYSGKGRATPEMETQV